MFADEWIEKGNVHCNIGNYKEALDAYDIAISHDVENAPVWNNKAFALYHLGKYQESLDACDTALSIDQNYVMAWNNKGDVFYKLDKYEEAIDCYDRALKISPNDKEILTSKERTQYSLKNRKSVPELRSPMKVKEIMTPNPIIVPITTPIKKIKEIFKSNKIWSVFIGSSEKYVGVITRKDLEMRGRDKPISTPVSAIMTKNPLSIDKEANVKDVIKILNDKKVNGLAVVQNGKPCGIVTRYDIKTRYSENYVPNNEPTNGEKTIDNSKEINGKIKRREVIKTAKLLNKSLKDQDIDEAYNYATDLLDTTDGEIKSLVMEIIAQLEARIENNIIEIPDEIIRKVKFLSHKIEMNC